MGVATPPARVTTVRADATFRRSAGAPTHRRSVGGVVTLTIDRARRLALSGQGLHLSRPDGRVDVRHLRRALASNHVVQLDSVSVAARAHEMPFWTRLGTHDRARRDEWLWDGHENVELAAHEQAVVPVALWPLFGHDRQRDHRWKAVDRLRRERPHYIEDVLAQVAARGPLTTAELDDGGGERRPGMWAWPPGRVALAWLADRGHVVQLRDRHFRIRYDLAERVLPGTVLDAPVPPLDEAHRRLLLLAARAHGVGTAKDLADHWRLRLQRRRSLADTRALLETMADAGELDRCHVRGWDEVAYRHPEVVMPRTVEGVRLLSPFDPLVWFRPRLERLWHFDYRIEIYVPREQRRWGYYVLPVLLDGALVARVDLKADRANATLSVRSAWAEAGADRRRVARALVGELAAHGAWLGCPDLAVEDVGDLAPSLRAAVG